MHSFNNTQNTKCQGNSTYTTSLQDIFNFPIIQAHIQRTDFIHKSLLELEDWLR